MLTAVVPLRLSCHVRCHVTFGYRELSAEKKSREIWEEVSWRCEVRTSAESSSEFRDRCERWSAASWFTHNISLQNCTTNISVKNCGPVKWGFINIVFVGRTLGVVWEPTVPPSFCLPGRVYKLSVLVVPAPVRWAPVLSLIKLCIR